MPIIEKKIGAGEASLNHPPSSSSPENHKNLLSRRDFLKGAAAIGAGIMFGNLPKSTLVSSEPLSFSPSFPSSSSGEKPTIKSQELTTQQIFAELTVSLEQLLQQPISIEGFSLFTDGQGEIQAILVNAAKQQLDAENNQYVASISIRLPDGTFSKFTPLWNLPPAPFKPSFIIQQKNGSIIVGLNEFWSGGSNNPDFLYLVSEDGGKTFVDEGEKIPDCDSLKEAPINIGDSVFHLYIPSDADNKPEKEKFFIRYPDGSIKAFSWSEGNRSLQLIWPGTYDIKRIGNQLRGYEAIAGPREIIESRYGIRKFTIGDINNPKDTLTEEILKSYDGDVLALAVRFGQTEAEDRIYASVSGADELFQIYDSYGHLLKQEYIEQWGVSGFDSIRIVGENKLLVAAGKATLNVGHLIFQPILILRDLTKEIGEEGALTSLLLLPIEERYSGFIPGQYNMQVGKINDQWFAFGHISSAAGELALFIQKFDPQNMRFIGEPVFIAQGMVKERIFMPVIMNQR